MKQMEQNKKIVQRIKRENRECKGRKMVTTVRRRTLNLTAVFLMQLPTSDILPMYFKPKRVSVGKELYASLRPKEKRWYI